MINKAKWIASRGQKTRGQMVSSNEPQSSTDVLLSCLDCGVRFVDLKADYVAGEEIYYEGKCPICKTQMPPENILNQIYHRAGIQQLYVNFDGDVCLLARAYLDPHTKEVKLDGRVEDLESKQSHREWAVKTLPEYVKFLKQLATAHFTSEEDISILNSGISELFYRIAACAEDFETAYDAFMQHELYYQDDDKAQDDRVREWNFLTFTSMWVTQNEWLSQNTTYLQGCYKIALRLSAKYGRVEAELGRKFCWRAGVLSFLYAKSLAQGDERRKVIEQSIYWFDTSISIAKTQGGYDTGKWLFVYRHLEPFSNIGYILSSAEHMGDLYEMLGDNQMAEAYYTQAWKIADSFDFRGKWESESNKFRDEFVVTLKNRAKEVLAKIITDPKVDATTKKNKKLEITAGWTPKETQMAPSPNSIVSGYIDHICSTYAVELEKQIELRLIADFKINIGPLCQFIRDYILHWLICFNLDKVLERLPDVPGHQYTWYFIKKRLRKAQQQELQFVLSAVYDLTSMGDKNIKMRNILREEDMPTIMHLVDQSLNRTEDFLKTKGKTLRRIAT